ncbi:cysteine-tryptophan domain-containing zinc finger protein 3-like isoform X3 [Impatiens glandulifera]|uniref:cysteine-tryptophan domain-containing zinc finger protein 3-like isoform X3 n=1 Tax=Impatiens glandulifera TaxID=253017 RepID=UPI001FB14F2D|nr:cysteine-tryptophan domain-containing zinc finger protein 3-like isoform X3 [Impatiens glandulifera]
MISVVSRDGRKRLPLDCSVEEKMDETELEEGEAFSSHEVDDSSIDPDALSYIDEKLQDFLGHFQKDFEGGVVSAENLGAMYGGYGSFLPTYQRSPPIAQNSVSNESINIKHIETSSQSNLVKEEPSSRLELVNHSAHSSDQKNLRVRIKVGSETVKKNSELYSGLGLDVSPASSLNDSTTDSEDGPDVSPTSILRIMTSLPLLDGVVLSPLTDHMVCLTEREKLRIDSARRSSSNGCHPGLKVKRAENGIRGPLKKEADIDIMDCDELVANTLKLPLLSRSADYAAKGNVKLDHNSEIADLVKEEEKLVSFSKPSAQALNGSKSQTEGVKGSSNWKAIKEECDMETTAVKEQTSLVGKKKPKSKHNVQDAKVTKDSSHVNGHLSKTKIGESKFHNHPQEGKNKYSDFFGDLELGQEDNDVDSVGTPSPSLEPIKSELVGKNTLNHHASKEMVPKLEAPSKGPYQVPPPSNNGPIGDAVHGLSVPPLVKEYWVGCDKCQKWRLLPLGIYPNSLPEKWLCSMLDWLPGMNRCSVSEEETTKAVTAHNLLPPSNGQAIQSGQSDVVVMSGPYSRNAVRADQSHENRGLPSMPCVAKKKPAVKEMSNSMDLGGTEQSLKKNIKASSQSRSLNEVGHIFPAADDLPPHKNKHKEKNKQLDYRSEGGDMRSSKITNKGGLDHSDQDEDLSSGAKRTKRDNNAHQMDEGGSFEKARPSSSSGLSVNASGKAEHRSKEHLKVNKSEGNNSSNYDAKDVRKRKLNEDSKQVYTDVPQDCRGTTEETNENNHKIVKRAKVSISGWKEGDSKGKSSIEPLVKESGSRQPSVAAASSSSKVSGSPVESVSSSPLRISTHDKAKLTRRDPEPKEDCRRNSDSQDEGRRERAFDAPGKNGEYPGVSRARVIEVPSQLENRRSADTHPPTKLPTIDHHGNDDGKRNENEGYLDTSHARKSGKGSLSRSKDSDGGFKDKLSNFSKEFADNSFPSEDIARSGKIRVMDKIDPVDKVAIQKAKSNTQLKLNVKVDTVSSKQEQKQNQNQRFDDDGEKSSRKSTYGKMDQIESLGREKSNLLPPSGRSQNEGLKLANGTSEGYGSVKRAKNGKTLESDQPTKPSPLRRDSFSQSASTAVKEAKDLKHMADRLKKNSGESGESTSLYFQAALKFLHGASLMELSSTETSKQNEMILSTQTYSSTAKLCDFCAHEYEKSKDMAHAALAYKCMEVAYLRVVYTSHNSASRARHELQTALHIVPGESPSSSASDVDNLNHLAAADKSLLTKGVSSPQIAEHVITAKNRPSFQRVLNFAQDANYAMEASRKFRAAFAAAKARNEENLSSVKRALDVNFSDVEGLLRLIRLAMDAMGR